MIRVLQVLPGLNRGGMETFIMNVYRSIDRTQIQFDFLVNSESGDYFDEIKALGGNIFYIPSRRKGYGKYLLSLKHFFKDHKSKYVAIHYHESSLTSLEPLYFAKKYGIHRRIIHSHNSNIKGNKLHYITHYFGKAFISNLATDYLGCSDKALKWMYQGTGIYNKAELIKNGVNTDDFKFNPNIRSFIRSRLNISDKIVVGHIGRFMEVKNHEFLLKIFNSLLKINPNFKLILVGCGELELKIKNLADDMGISEYISFLGVRSDINDLLQAMDVFVMPSLYEGLPVVLVEAQTSGLPIVCSDTISSMSKLTPQYYTCSLSDSLQVWSDTIQEALNSGYHRKNAVTYIKKAGFDINSVANRLAKLYKL